MAEGADDLRDRVIQDSGDRDLVPYSLRRDARRSPRQDSSVSGPLGVSDVTSVAGASERKFVALPGTGNRLTRSRLRNRVPNPRRFCMTAKSAPQLPQAQQSRIANVHLGAT